MTDTCILFPSERAGDIRYTGAAVHDGLLELAVTTYAPWKTPSYNASSSGASGDIYFFALFDTNGDGNPDYETDAFRAPGTDVLLAETYDINNGYATVDDEFINAVDPTTDTDLLNSDSMILPVALAAIGNPTKVTYGFTSQSFDDQGGSLDQSDLATVDLAHPGVSVGTGSLADDQPGNLLPVTHDLTDTTQDNPNTALLLHLHNADGSRAELVPVKTAQTLTLPAVASHTVGDADFTVTATTTAAGLTPTLSAAPSAVCTATGTTVHLVGPGTCTLTASQGGNATYAAAAPAVESFTVAGARSVPGVSHVVYPGPFVSGQPVPVVVSVSASNPTGSVSVKEGTTTLVTAPLAGTAVLLTVPGLKAGTHQLVATYSGDGTTPPGTSAATPVTVGKGRSKTAAGAPGSSTSHKVKVSVTVTAVAPAVVSPVTGTVTVSSGGKKLATLTLVNGKGSGTIKLAKGKHTVTFTYGGSSELTGSSVRKAITITT
jgi:hypothetical protein